MEEEERWKLHEIETFEYTGKETFESFIDRNVSIKFECKCGKVSKTFTTKECKTNKAVFELYCKDCMKEVKE